MAKFITMKNIHLSNYLVNQDGDIVKIMCDGSYKPMTLRSNRNNKREVARYELTDDFGERMFLSLDKASKYFDTYYTKKVPH